MRFRVLVAHTEVTLRLLMEELIRSSHSRLLLVRRFCRFWRFGLKNRPFAAAVETQCSPTKANFLGFNSDAVVHCVLQPLSAPKGTVPSSVRSHGRAKTGYGQALRLDVTEPGTEFFCSFHSANPSRQLGAKKAGISSLIGQSPHGGQSQVNRGRSQLTGFQLQLVT